MALYDVEGTRFVRLVAVRRDVVVGVPRELEELRDEEDEARDVAEVPAELAEERQDRVREAEVFRADHVEVARDERDAVCVVDALEDRLNEARGREVGDLFTGEIRLSQVI